MASAPPPPPTPPATAPIPKTAPTLPRKNVKTELNGLLKILLKPNLNALDAKSAVKPKTFLNPIVAAVNVAPITINPVVNFPFNLFNNSIFPSAFALIISITVFVNQPPANIKKKLTNLCNTP